MPASLKASLPGRTLAASPATSCRGRLAPARLRAGCPRPPARPQALPAVDRDHALPPRPLGHLVPWTSPNAYGPQEHRIQCALWLPPGGRRQLHEFADHWGNEAMVEDAFDIREFEPRVPFTTASLKVEACSLPTRPNGFRVPGDAQREHLAYSGGSAPTGELAQLAQAADLSCARQPSPIPRRTGTRAGTCPPRKGSPLRTVRPSSRTARSSCRRPRAFPSQPTVSSSKSRKAR
jgi:hypothetical protein